MVKQKKDFRNVHWWVDTMDAISHAIFVAAL